MSIDLIFPPGVEWVIALFAILSLIMIIKWFIDILP